MAIAILAPTDEPTTQGTLPLSLRIENLSSLSAEQLKIMATLSSGEQKAAAEALEFPKSFIEQTFPSTPNKSPSSDSTEVDDQNADSDDAFDSPVNEDFVARLKKLNQVQQQSFEMPKCKDSFVPAPLQVHTSKLILGPTVERGNGRKRKDCDEQQQPKPKRQKKESRPKRKK